MKTLLVITLTLIVSIHSSGWEPRAAMCETHQPCDEHDGGGSGLPPGAIEAIPVLFNDNLTTTFTTIDITIDPLGQPLAAYQFELTSEDASFTVVGVEGGEHIAFDHGRPPYFDPVAKQGETDRLILAEYALPQFDEAQLPTQAIRVATVHVMFAGPLHENDNPTIQLKLTTAGNADGERIEAEIRYSFRTPERPESR